MPTQTKPTPIPWPFPLWREGDNGVWAMVPAPKPKRETKREAATRLADESEEAPF